MAQKNATLRALIEGVIYDLMPKGSVYNVWVDDTTTLAEKLAEVITSLNGKVTPEELTSAIEQALAGFEGGGGESIIKPFVVDDRYRIDIDSLEDNTFYYLEGKADSSDLIGGAAGETLSAAKVRKGVLYYNQFTRVEDSGKIHGRMIGGDQLIEYNYTPGYYGMINAKRNHYYLYADPNKDIEVDYTPVYPNHPATKKYVDDTFASFAIPDVEKGNWNQNDPEAADYIKNRTHYVEYGDNRVEILPASSLALNEENGAFMLLDAIELTAGKQYVVKFTDSSNNEVEYTTMCVDAPENEDGMKWMLGDAGLMEGTPTTGEPFIMVVLDPSVASQMGIGALVMWIGGTMLQTISISAPEEIVHKLDPKYLPDVYSNGSGGGSGAGSTDVLLGQTPVRFTKAANMVRLVGEGDVSYTIESDTVSDLESASSQSLNNATMTRNDGYVEIKSTSGASGWYQSYVDIVMGGLVVGEKYTFVVDASGISWDETNRISNGKFIVYDASGSSTLLTVNVSNVQSNVYSADFTATTTSVKVRAYPGDYMWQAGATAARFNSIYINKSGTSTLHTTIINENGTFNGSVLLPGLSAGVYISSDPVCYVYTVQSADSSSGSRHNGKVMVCFGDSITGNMTAPNDYPSVVARETGMDVINAGFGGCRMSDTHSDAAYAAFSMVKLADAVSSGDWTLQDSNVSGLSTVTNGTAHLEALKAVDWSKVDFVSIAYGTNDIQNAIAIDSDTDKMSTKTFLGSLRYSITKILTAYPHIKLILLTPIYRYFNDESVDSDQKQFGGKAFTDWGDGIISVAKEYKVPHIDMYHTLGINSINRTYYFPASDGTHPNAKGLALFGGKLSARILSEY